MPAQLWILTSEVVANAFWEDGDSCGVTFSDQDQLIFQESRTAHEYTHAARADIKIEFTHRSVRLEHYPGPVVDITDWLLTPSGMTILTQNPDLIYKIRPDDPRWWHALSAATPTKCRRLRQRIAARARRCI